MAATTLPVALSILLALAGGAPESPPVKSVRVKDTTLAYVEQGRGEPVVLLHGWGLDYRVWSAQVEGLSNRYRVITYSRRHNSPNPPIGDGSSYSDAVNEADLVSLLRALGIRRAHLIGHFYGGSLALLVARDHPRLVRSLVLAEPVVESTLAGNAEVKTLPPIPFGEAGEAFQRGDVEEAARMLGDAIIGRKGAYDEMPPDFRKLFLDNLSREMRAASSAPRGSRPAFTCEDARSVKAPILFVEGERTLRFFQIATEELAKCLPSGSERKVLAGATHALEVENPAGFDEIVLEFLARH
jgi:pimeloyl-ACP methyl ester carboxylesterase